MRLSGARADGFDAARRKHCGKSTNLAVCDIAQSSRDISRSRVAITNHHGTPRMPATKAAGGKKRGAVETAASITPQDHLPGSETYRPDDNNKQRPEPRRRHANKTKSRGLGGQSRLLRHNRIKPDAAACRNRKAAGETRGKKQVSPCSASQTSESISHSCLKRRDQELHDLRGHEDRNDPGPIDRRRLAAEILSTRTAELRQQHGTQSNGDHRQTSDQQGSP
jgi:hypothetical protein